MKTFSYLLNLILLIFWFNGSPVVEGEGGKSVLCHIEGNSVLRPQEKARFTPEDLDLTICTHVVYNRAVVSPELTLVPRNAEVDLQDGGGLGMMNRTVALKDAKPELQVYLDNYDDEKELGKEQVYGNHTALENFAKNAADFVESHGFDGMNIRVTQGSKGLEEVAPILKEEFVRRGLKLILFHLPKEIHRIENYNLTETFSRNFDLIIIGSYWKMPFVQTEILASVAVLESVVEDLTARGIPAEKLVVAIPAFSVTVKLCDRSDGGIHSAICEGGNEGTIGPSEMMIYDIELRRKMSNASEDWVVTRDEESKMSYGHSRSLEWGSFEDPESVRVKAQFILERNLAGAAIMNADMEDFKGAFTEGGETFPLTRAVFKVLNGEQP